LPSNYSSEENGFTGPTTWFFIGSMRIPAVKSLVGRKSWHQRILQKVSFLKSMVAGSTGYFHRFNSLLLIQGWAEQKLLKRKANNLHIATIVLAAAGLFFTWYDFRHTITHRLLGERFHIGAYLFWIGWMIISLFYLTQQKKEIAEP